MEKTTVLTLKEKKTKKEKITMLTAYDFPTAQLVDRAGVDLILVGDSLGMAVLGYDNTLAVTLDDMIHHGRAVARGAQQAMVVTDMPFLTYHISTEEALRNAGKIIQETGSDAVKVEGGANIIDTVKGITSAGIPVMGHLGLTPQSSGQMGGFKVQGKSIADARAIISDALELEKAGVFAIVLECIPAPLARLITQKINVPTVGIGAGIHCDGQVLVFHDITGLYTGPKPRFVKQYLDGATEMNTAIQKYIAEVKKEIFPADQHSFSMPPEMVAKLTQDDQSPIN